MVEIVAEISGNHDGSLEKALNLITTAAISGCDYAKFQYYLPGDMPDRHHGLNWDLYHKLSVPDDWLPKLFKRAKLCSIGLFASVFSGRAARKILEYDVPYIKLASPKSTLLSQETIDDILDDLPDDVEVITSCDLDHWERMGWSFPKVLYCPEGHPPTITEHDFTEFRRHNYWGFSDHTPGIRAPLAFARAGARMIEKHFKLEDDNDCIDAKFSADPETMAQLCRIIRNTP